MPTTGTVQYPDWQAWNGGLSTGTLPYTLDQTWLSWTLTSTANTAVLTTWTDWNASIAGSQLVTAVPAYTLDTTWLTWQTTYATGSLNAWAPCQQPELTPEERQRQERERARRAAAWRRQEAKRQKERAAAMRRARGLLSRHLTNEQRAEFDQHGYFHVISGSGRMYRIHRGQVGNVRLVEAPDDAKVIQFPGTYRPKQIAEGSRFCIHPRERVPDEDNMLAQKLMLEAAEEDFWRIANVS